MQRHISSLPIPDSYKAKLTKSGIEFVNDFKALKPTDLIKGERNRIIDFRQRDFLCFKEKKKSSRRLGIQM